VHRRFSKRAARGEPTSGASPQTAPAFARVIATDVGTDGIDEVIRVAQARLPQAGQQPGFAGFYLLADRTSGRLMTISLWSSRDDVVAAEAQAAQLRGETATLVGVATPDVGIYEVVVQG
jgi:heme-degrading monooxygenase HmoA